MSHKRKTTKPKRRDVRLEQLKGILERTRGVLSEEDHQTLESAVDTLAVLTVELEKKGASIRRLRQMLFGARTEKTCTIFGNEEPQDTPQAAGKDAPAEPSDKTSSDRDTEPCAGKKPRRKGHGRNGVADYRGAKRVPVSHPTLERGDPCPACPKGKLYPLKEPATLVRITAMAPLQACILELERLRCNACSLIFTASPPDGSSTAKYDETAQAMIGLLRYGTGLPWNRLEQLQSWLGIPMPASTQWELVRDAEPALAPVLAELVRQAAQGKVLHNDDTTMKVLEMMEDAKPLTPAAKAHAASDDDRTGVYTTGIVSLISDHRVALFFTGPRHAGENLEAVLKKRAADLGAPIQMSDALSHNTAGAFDTITASCLAHARRRFVDVVVDFPDECKVVLDALRKVYRLDTGAKKLGYSDEQRLAYHQQLSKPIMDELEAWLKRQFEQKLVEPNSGLGEAIQYMTKHWSKLTLFLREPGAPLDNNIVEQALKKAILHRKNSLFYRTMNGARVGDTFMSLIHSAELAAQDPFHYLVSILRNATAASKQPADWMPWNYAETLIRLATPAVSDPAPPPN
jgi:hypothetical protein